MSVPTTIKIVVITLSKSGSNDRKIIVDAAEAQEIVPKITSTTKDGWTITMIATEGYNRIIKDSVSLSANEFNKLF